MRMKGKRFYSHLYFWVLVGMVLGVLVGCLFPEDRPLRLRLFGTSFMLDGTDLKPLSDAFIRLIRMVIAPIIFTTVVTGIAGMGNLKRLGRIGVKSLVYFEVMTTLALIIGWVVAKSFHTGIGMNADPARLDVKELTETLVAAPQQRGMIHFLN